MTGENCENRGQWVIVPYTDRRGRTRYRWQYQTEEVCTEFDFWEYYTESENDGEEPTGTGWEEGRIYLSSDVETRNTCDQMREDGITVYSIGFALDAGRYETNEWQNLPGAYSPFTVTPDTKEKATAVPHRYLGARRVA